MVPEVSNLGEPDDPEESDDVSGEWWVLVLVTWGEQRGCDYFLRGWTASQVGMVEVWETEEQLSLAGHSEAYYV